MADLLRATRRLSDLSARQQRAVGITDWPAAVERPGWFVSPELVSIHGGEIWAGLDERQQQELSFWEAVNFFSLNVHGERLLMAGLAQRMYRPGLVEATEYLHHFLAEENTHSVWFGTFCQRYAGKVYPERSVPFESDVAADVADLLFFARVLLFEQLVDRYNTSMAADERLDPLVRRINADHHADEARHLVFGRELVAELWSRSRPSWDDETVDAVRAHLLAYVDVMWREYYNPGVYADAGLPDPWGLAREVWSGEPATAHRAALTAEVVRPLVESGILDAAGSR